MLLKTSCPKFLFHVIFKIMFKCVSFFLFRCCSWLWRRCCQERELKSRTIVIGHPSSEKFPANVIRNQKYNLITFLPLVSMTVPFMIRQCINRCLLYRLYYRCCLNILMSITSLSVCYTSC